VTNTEFAEIIGFLTAGCGKPLAVESQVVYFDLLGDLSAETLWLAARRVLLEHPWATFPSVAELRQAAAESARGEIRDLAPSEAWELAWYAVTNFVDPEAPASLERAKARLPALVWRTIEAFPLVALVYGKEPVGVLRGQFLRMYQDYAERARREALFQPATLAALENIRDRKAIPASLPVAGFLAGIGKAVEDA
jgi:hypothetical protein